jgi:hypothetical protein
MKSSILILAFLSAATAVAAPSQQGCNDCSNRGWEQTFERASPIDPTSSDLQGKVTKLVDANVSTNDPSYPNAAVYFDFRRPVLLANAGRWNGPSANLEYDVSQPPSVLYQEGGIGSGDWVTCQDMPFSTDLIRKITYRRDGDTIIFKQEFIQKSDGSSRGIYFGVASLTIDIAN